MSLETYIQAMPKAALHVQLEGAVPKETLLRMAEQNNVAARMKRRRDFDKLVELLNNPEVDRLDEIARESATWVRYAEDLARVVYDVGLNLSRQNVKYAEISVIPSLYTEMEMSFEAFLEAINDGRDRVERAWGIKIRWILSIPRDEPRKADEIARWATGATARKGNVEALGLVGQFYTPAGQFSRAFSTAARKEVARVVQICGRNEEPEDIIQVIETLDPQRLTDVRGIEENVEVLDFLESSSTPVVVSPAQAEFLGEIEDKSSFPIKKMIDENLTLVIGSGMSQFYGVSLLDEYQAAAQQLSVTELEKVALNAVLHSFMPEEEKAQMVSEFADAYERLRDEHLREPEAES